MLSCPYCIFRCEREDTLVDHVKMVHPGMPVPCVIPNNSARTGIVEPTYPGKISVMNNEPYVTTHTDIVTLIEKRSIDLLDTAKKGQKEYAHKDSEALRNFNSLAKELGIPREKVLWIFLKKHLDGVLAHINGHRSQREPVHGRLQDAHVYLFLLEAMFNEDERNERNSGV